MTQESKLTIFTDGASRGNPGESGIGILFIDENSSKIEIKEYVGIGTNNQAEYKALVRALIEAKKLKSNNIEIFSDSMLVVNQVNGNWKVKDSGLKELFIEVKNLLTNFSKINITHIPREKNKDADRLANEAINEYFNY